MNPRRRRINRKDRKAKQLLNYIPLLGGTKFYIKNHEVYGTWKPFGPEFLWRDVVK